jgi:hypothetical protein
MGSLLHKILKLPLDCIGLGVTTLAAAASVIVVDRKPRCKEAGKLWSGPEGPGTQGSHDEDESRALADLIVSDRGSIS